MAWLCVDCDGTEWFSKKIMPHRSAWGYWADAQVIVDDKPFIKAKTKYINDNVEFRKGIVKISVEYLDNN